METESDSFVPLMKRSKGFEGLFETVIARELCSLCGGCQLVCERVRFGSAAPEPETGAFSRTWKLSDATRAGMTPELVKECNMKLEAIRCGEDGSCYDNCPMTVESLEALEEKIFGSPTSDKEFGQFLEIVGARSLKEEVRTVAQDGGTVTSLLLAALSKNLIEGAVVTGKSSDWAPGAHLATTPEEIIDGAGTKYSRTPAAAKIAPSLRTKKNLAFVGTSCQTTAASNYRHQFLGNISQVNLFIIGLFCFENFPHDRLIHVLEKKFGISINKVVKTDITKGKFRVELKDGKILEENVSTFNSIVPLSCQVCTNFTARLADISVGAIGTPLGWNTVIIRTPKGKELIDSAIEEGFIETTSEVDLEAIKKNIRLKEKKRAAHEEKIPSIAASQ
ncbi:MAG: Coenzyme F420 hydrogenase/dehydrogenase, beta subunit C-terminal domain [Promethearchaeota archaeon]